jgi:hypothetical protein
MFGEDAEVGTQCAPPRLSRAVRNGRGLLRLQKRAQVIYNGTTVSHCDMEYNNNILKRGMEYINTAQQ